MSERVYRVMLGGTLLVFLFFKLEYFIYIYIAFLFFEGVTNLRIPRLITMLRFGNKAGRPPENKYKFNFEAERLMRFVMGLFLILTVIVLPEQAWFFPWFIGFMLMLAGIVNLCPVVLTLRWAGFR